LVTLNNNTTALARSVYEVENPCGPQWAYISAYEKQRYCDRADMIAIALDRHGYELRFIPPEG